jgi:hypothetical protein
VSDVAPGSVDPRGRLSHTSSDAGDRFIPSFPCFHLQGGDGTASCQFTVTPKEVGSGEHTITVTYNGDPAT